MANSETQTSTGASSAAPLLIIGLTVLTASLGGWGSSQAPSFYAALNQPIWAPPAWLFGPVWTALYSLMALTAFLVWRRVNTLSHRVLRIYFVQLLFNGLWSFLFFSWHWGGAALIDIALLFALILVLMRETFVISPRISLMWLPYALWVFFAGILNLTLWQMNPEPLNFFDAGSGFELSII